MTDDELMQVTSEEVWELSDEDFRRLLDIYDEDDDVYNEMMRRCLMNMGEALYQRSQAMADEMHKQYIMAKGFEGLTDGSDRARGKLIDIAQQTAAKCRERYGTDEAE